MLIGSAYQSRNSQYCQRGKLVRKLDLLCYNFTAEFTCYILIREGRQRFLGGRRG